MTMESLLKFSIVIIFLISTWVDTKLFEFVSTSEIYVDFETFDDPEVRILVQSGTSQSIKTLEEYLAQTTTESSQRLNQDAGRTRANNENLFKPNQIVTSPNKDLDNKNKTIKQQQQQQQQPQPQPQPQPSSVTSTSLIKPIPHHYQVKSLLNVSHDYPLAYSQIICGFVWPVMAIITLFTNLMIVFVLIQRDMRTPTNVVLTAIAIADIIPIVVPVPWFVYLFAMGNENQVLYPPIICYFYQHSTRSVSEIFYFISTWLNLLLAIQDYMTACWPELAKRHCKIAIVVWEICILTSLAFILNLPQALKLVFKPIQFYYNDQLTWGCRRLQAKWFKDLIGEYAALYDDIFTAIIVIFVDGGPAIALIILTSLLIRQLKRQRIQGHKLMEQARTASKRRRELRRQQEVESSARVLIFVLLAFLAVKIPFATIYTLMIIQSRFEIHFVENLLEYQKAISLTDLVFVLSYPVNFTIFCCCSKRFRHKCLELLGSHKSKPNIISDKRRQNSALYRDNSMDDSNYNDDETTIGTGPSLNDSNLEDYPMNIQIPAIQVEPAPGSITNGEWQSANDYKPPSQESEISTNYAESGPHQHDYVTQLASRTNENFDEQSNALSLSQKSQVEVEIKHGILCYECIVRYEQLCKRPLHHHDQHQHQHQHHSNEASEPKQLEKNNPTFINKMFPLTSSDSDSSSIFDWPMPPDIQLSSIQHMNLIQQHQVHYQDRTTRRSSCCSSNRLKLSQSELSAIKESRSGSETSRQTTHGFTEHERKSLDAANSAAARSSSIRQSSGPAASCWTRDKKHRDSWLAPSYDRRSISLSDSKLTSLPKATGMLADTMLSLILSPNKLIANETDPNCNSKQGTGKR